MKKTTIMFAIMLGVACTASAQKTGKKKAQKSVKTEQVSNVSSDQEEKLTLTKEVYPQKEENSNLYHGLTKKLTFDRMIPPHGLEVTYDKTVHILFPASVKYVDLGSEDLIAGKADGAENVIRVKAAVKNFKKETNMSVITEDGSFYTFNVKYAKEPLMLNIEMADFIHDGEAVNRPNNAQEIYLKELGKESPMLVHLIMKSIHKGNKRKVKHIGSKRFGIQYLLKGIYVHSDLLYFHTEIRGLYQYYRIADNIAYVGNTFGYIMRLSFCKTLAKKLNSSTRKILLKYMRNHELAIPYKDRKGDTKFRIFYNDGFAKQQPENDADCDKLPNTFVQPRPTLAERLMERRCELCGATNVYTTMYQVRKLTELKATTEWHKLMLKKWRKTLVVCENCNAKIHNYDK